MKKEYSSANGEIWSYDSDQINLTDSFSIPITKRKECSDCGFCIPRTNLGERNVFGISEEDFGICVENCPKGIKVIMTNCKKELKCRKIKKV